MHILLVNANPVVSRLFMLCTRDDTLLLDEVKTVSELYSNDYDIVFVDEASYGRDIAELLKKFENTKKVFISYRNDDMRGFDVTIKKPFLPSQITDIIAEVEEYKDDNLFGENTTGILDGNEIEKIKELLDMNDGLKTSEIELNDEDIEVRKIEVIKEHLIADGLEIVDENNIVEELSGVSKGAKKIKKVPKKDKLKSKKHINIVICAMNKNKIKKLLKGKEVKVKIKLEGKN